MFTDNIPQCNFNEAHYQKAWENYFRLGIGVIFLAENAGEILGGIGGVKFQEDLSGEWYAVEKFWYMKPEYRKSSAGIKLLRSFERWAVANGCEYSAMIDLQCSMVDKIDVFYERDGYKLLEKHHVKRVKK